jgi:hypothetical protein
MILALFMLTAYVGIQANEKRIFIWLPEYMKYEMERLSGNGGQDATTDIMLFIADHHEIKKNLKKEVEFIKRLKNLSNKHEDSGGKKFQYTFFYVYDGFNPEVARTIVSACAEGYGDIELHWHMSNETSESYRKKLKDALEKFSEIGALTTIDGKTAFGFIHGNWNLDNTPSLNGSVSGVTNEIELLRKEGCFADFTFPAFGTDAQPRTVNSIYYVLDDPQKPKSYDSGIPLEVGKQKPDERLFMIFQGPMFIGFRLSNLFSGRRPFYIERGTIQDSDLPTPSRADGWVKHGVHIKGRPEWKFIKIHAHGAMHPNAVLGDDMDKTLTYLEKNYNDGKKYRLHYVTAREAYNIVKAAEAGLTGNPEKYRDYLVKKYKYTESAR